MDLDHQQLITDLVSLPNSDGRLHTESHAYPYPHGQRNGVIGQSQQPEEDSLGGSSSVLQINIERDQADSMVCYVVFQPARCRR